MVMDIVPYIKPYIETDNALLLEDILKKQLPKAGLNIEFAQRIANDDPGYKVNLQLVINWCKESIKEYTELKGAICKGELVYQGSRLLNIANWRFNKNIINREIVYIENFGIKRTLTKEGIENDTLTKLMQQIEGRRRVTYEDVTDAKNIVWFRELQLALDYTKDFLTIEDTRPKMEAPKRHISERKLYTKREEILEEEPLEITTKEQFLAKYRLDENSYSNSQTPITKDGIEQVLHLWELNESELTLISRTIKRNANFLDILLIKGSQDYSTEKVITLAKFYAHAPQEKVEEFWNDIERTLRVKRP